MGANLKNYWVREKSGRTDTKVLRVFTSKELGWPMLGVGCIVRKDLKYPFPFLNLAYVCII